MNSDLSQPPQADDPNIQKLENDLKTLENQSQAGNQYDTQQTTVNSPFEVVGKKKSPLLLFAIILVAISLLVTLVYIFGSQLFVIPKACTMEAKICPDGSSVGRSGPNCEFSACPMVVETMSPLESAIPSGMPSVSNLPADLISAVKQDAVNQSNPKIIADKVVIGDSKIEGNYAMVAFGYIDGGGAIDWLVNTNGIWKVVVGGQEPPSCSTLKSYNFPSDFSCNQP